MCAEVQPIDIRIPLSEMEAVRQEAHKILKADPPEGEPHRWFPHVLRRAAKNVRRRRQWEQRQQQRGTHG